MAKSAINRHHAERIAKNWQRKAKAHNNDHMLKWIGFGFTYKQDPYDCGIPNCYGCHDNKSYDKSHRLEARQQERKSLEDYLNGLNSAE